MRSYNPTPTRPRSPSTWSAGNLFGTTRTVRPGESHRMVPRVPLHLKAVLRHDDAQLELLPGLEVEILERCGQLDYLPPADGMVPVGLRKDLAGGGRVQPECAGLGAAQRED